MKKRVKIILPFDLILDQRVSANSVRVYAVLKSFAASSPVKGVYPSTVVTHRQIAERCGLSEHTIKKCLSQLETRSWINKEIRSGSANRYIFTQIIFA